MPHTNWFQQAEQQVIPGINSDVTGGTPAVPAMLAWLLALPLLALGIWFLLYQ